MKEDISMSIKEINQIEIMEKLKRREISQKKAAVILRLSVRQTQRKLYRYKKYGAKSLSHKSRGKKSNNRVSERVLHQAIEVIKKRYSDFGPTLATEKLEDEHEIKLSVETVRKLMISEGIWKTRRRKRAHVHQLRERRSCFGELVQMDGSPHAWFEDRGHRCNLNVLIDDATGIPHLRFSESETTQSYFEIIESYIKKYGIPVATYTDKHSIFKVNNPEQKLFQKPKKHELTNFTQFGRAMKELGVEVICANTPQAKGRVERINKTLQDRLVKELRLQGISTIHQANQFLPTFTKKFIKKFSVLPKLSLNMHRKLNEKADLSSILCVKETRVLSKNLTCQFNNRIYQIHTNRSAYTLRKTLVTFQQRYDNSITIVDHRGNLLDYSIAKVINSTKVRSSKTVNQLVDQLLLTNNQNNYSKKNPWETNFDQLTDDYAFYKRKRTV